MNKFLKDQNEAAYVCKECGVASAFPPSLVKGQEGTGKENWYIKKKYYARMKRLRERRKPQFGLESLGAVNFCFDALAKFAGVDLPDTIMREIEGAVILITNLSQQNTMTGVMSSIALYVRSYVTSSMTKTVMDYISDLFKETQSGDEANNPTASLLDDAPNWLTALRNIRSNWTLCKNNKAFRQLSKLLGILVTLGLCKSAALDFEIGGFKVFTGSLYDRHMSAFDLMDALFETVIFFTEGLYLCFKTKSIKPLLMNDFSAIELDEEYARVINWWTLVRCGNLEKIANMSTHEFDKRLQDLGTKLKNLLPTLSGLDKKLINDKFSTVLTIQNDFITMRLAGGTRHAPFSVEFFGKSSQGKTTICDQVITCLLASQNQPTGKEFRCTYNPSDAYMSGWLTSMLVLKFDDVANEKSNFVQNPPTKPIIEVNNNEMYYANKAEITMKARCFVEPWITTATTNKKDLDAGVYSNCPYSIQRRFIVVTVNAKPKFQKIIDGKCCGIDPQKVKAYYTDKDGNNIERPFDDIWTVTVERAVEPEKLSTVAKYSILKDRNGKPLKNIGMAKLVEYLIEEYAKHIENQKAIVAKSDQINVVKRCSDSCHYIKGYCPVHKNSQRGYESVKVLKHLCGKAKLMLSPDLDYHKHKLDDKVAQVIYDKGSEWLSSWNWVKLVPQPVLGTKRAEELIKWYFKEEIEVDARRKTTTMWLWTLVMASIFLAIPFGFIISLFIVWHSINHQKNFVTEVEDALVKQLREENLKVASVVRKVRDERAKYICGAVFGLGALYALAKAYKKYYQSLPQGSLEPKTQKEVDERDAEANVWTSVVQRELPITEVSKTVRADVLEKTISKNLVYGSIHCESGRTGMVNGLFLNSNLILIPHHYFLEFGSNLKCTFRKCNPESSGGKFAANISLASSYHIPNTDLTVCYIATGGSYRNLIKHFPIGDMPSVPFLMQWRKKEGELLKAKGMTVPGMTSTNVTFRGGDYKNLTMDTFEGLCGATLISDTVGSVILGVHLGGIAGTRRGCYGSLTQEELIKAIGHVRSMEGVLITGSAGKFDPTVMGVKITTDQELHPKSAVNYMPHNSQVEWLGTCIGKNVQKSDVKVTPISEDLISICDAPNVYCAPKFNPEWYAFQACLSNLAVPAHPYPHKLLQVAVMDYKEPLIDLFRTKLWNNIAPLSDKENVNGVPGLRFLDGIKINTSAGIPMKGKKRDYIVEVEEPEGTVYRKFDQAVLDEIDRCENLYREGERAYCIAKACRKDEILTKEKCRIFYGNSTPLTFLIRKYYLPILRVLQMNPKVAECAVGINAHGPEWEEFHQYATKFGMDRLFGGDYGKYDQKLPSQLILAALRILIDCARVCPGYMEEDLRIMEAMSGDIVFAYIAFNGDLIGLTEGTHISGNSLTVIINGICGSLNLRCYYYTQYPVTEFSERRKFRDYVAAVTYGDDNIGSVNKDEHKFTIKGISEFLASYGQVYTMPDKESELLDFLPESEFEFLKRKTVYIPELGGHVGALVEKSIFKSLHCFMRPKGAVMTEYQAVAQNIDQNLGEWFNHGREVYDKRRSEMKIIASKHDISHMCSTLDMTFEDRIQAWKEKYDKKHVMFSMPNMEFLEELAM